MKIIFGPRIFLYVGRMVLRNIMKIIPVVCGSFPNIFPFSEHFLLNPPFHKCNFPKTPLLGEFGTAPSGVKWDMRGRCKELAAIFAHRYLSADPLRIVCDY